MPTDELDSLLAEETLRMERFSTEVRAQMRALMAEIERDFQQFIDRVLGEQVARLESEAAAISPDAHAPAYGAAIGGGLAEAFGNVFNDSGSILGDALNAVVNAASTTLIRGGNLTPRSIVNAGGRVIASQIENVSLRTNPDGMRLSRAQIGEGMMKELGRGHKNG